MTQSATNSAPTSPAAHASFAASDGRLRALGLHKRYPTPGEPLVVLRGVSLELSPGESLAIVGPSGSGKSTLLNILGTLDSPTEGTVTLGDAAPFSLPPGELARFRAERIGFVFQDHHLLPQCTATENVLLPRLALGRVRPDDAQRALHLLERAGLAGRAEHLPSELSGGERQRVAVARALMNQPSLVLADEPTGNLDARASEAVGELLAETTAEARAILIVVTHSDALARRFSRRLRMSDGQLVQE
ncbi:MAG: ABC transporter ATP-binding protein [Tepidisphaeraceae bacterium]